MRSDKSLALKLRLSGKSYGEINRSLGVPKSTLSDWFRDLDLPQKAKARLAQKTYQKSTVALIRHNRAQTHIAQQNTFRIRKDAKSEIKNLSNRDLLLLGISIYWTEGYKRPIITKGKIKTHHPVTLSNSDPGLVKIYLRFLREICQVAEDKITGEIRFSKHHNEAYLLNLWSKITNIPFNRLKTVKNNVNISNQRKRPFSILPNGTIQIRVNNTNLYHKIMGWIEGLAEV